jgi:predicted TIM-barrel fold metal-dependent hydrolase
MAWKHQNVFIGTSMHYPRYWPPQLVAFLNSRGMGKVLFGSDYPGLSYGEALEQVKEMGLKKNAEEYLLRKAALQVFKLE